MTKQELIKALDQFGDDEVIVCAYEDDLAWDNIQQVCRANGQMPTIIFGGGSPFSDE